MPGQTLTTIGEGGWLVLIRLVNAVDFEPSEKRKLIIDTLNNIFEALLLFFKPRDQIVQHMRSLLKISIFAA